MLLAIDINDTVNGIQRILRCLRKIMYPWSKSINQSINGSDGHTRLVTTHGTIWGGDFPVISTMGRKLNTYIHTCIQTYINGSKSKLTWMNFILEKKIYKVDRNRVSRSN